MKLLREASQAQGVETKPVELYQRICKATTREPIDIPLLVFYDSSAADDERDMSEDTSEKMFEHTSQMDEGSHHEDELRRNGPPQSQSQSEKPSDEVHQSREDSLRVPSSNPHHPTKAAIESLSNEDPAKIDREGTATKQKALSEFVRAAYTGCEEHSLLFPPTIPPPIGEEYEESIATHPVFLRALRKVQTTHQHVILTQDDMKEFTQYLDKMALGDEITTVAIMP